MTAPVAFLEDVRIVGVRDWDWNANTCAVTFARDTDAAEAPRRFQALSLPPFASPVVRYTVAVNCEDRTVTRWCAAPPKLDTSDDAVMTLLGAKITSCAAALAKEMGMPPSATALENLMRRATLEDVQVLACGSSCGDLAGAFDGLCLTTMQRIALLENYETWGRKQVRNFKRPHARVFPLPADGADKQHGDFERCFDISLRQHYMFREFWTATRWANCNGLRVTPAVLKASVSAQDADKIIRVFETEHLFDDDKQQVMTAPAVATPEEAARPVLPDRRVLTSRSAPCVVTQSPEACVALKEVVWFAPSAASCSDHPKGEMPSSQTKVKGYALIEGVGVRHVLQIQRHDVVLTPLEHQLQGDQQKASRGACHMLGQVPVLEGGADLFVDGTLANVGFFCMNEDARPWTTSLKRAVLRKLQTGGHVHTNANALLNWL